MFISKKGPNLRRPTGIKINVKGDEVKKDNKAVEDKKPNKPAPKKDVAPAEDKKEGETK